MVSNNASLGYSTTFSSLTKVLLYSLQDAHAACAIHHVDGDPLLAEATRAPDAVQVCLTVRVPVKCDREIKVHHNRHHLNVDAWKENRYHKN